LFDSLAGLFNKFKKVEGFIGRGSGAGLFERGKLLGSQAFRKCSVTSKRSHQQFNISRQGCPFGPSVQQ
jgi:hypothetical protein